MEETRGAGLEEMRDMSVGRNLPWRLRKGRGIIMSAGAQRPSDGMKEELGGGNAQLPLDEELDVVEGHGPGGFAAVVVAVAVVIMGAKGGGRVDVAEVVELLEGLLAGLGCG